MWSPSWNNGKQISFTLWFSYEFWEVELQGQHIGLLCFMVSKFLMQHGPWDTGLMHFVPSMKCQVCIYCSNYPLHIYRLNIDSEITHCDLSGISTGPNSTSIFHNALKPNLLLRYLKVSYTLINSWLHLLGQSIIFF